LGIDISFQLSSDVNDKLSRFWGNLTGMGVGGLGLVSIPLSLPRLVSMEPFEEPFLGSPHFTINRNGLFALHVLFDSYLSQGSFFHRITSRVGFTKDILQKFQPQGNRCFDTKANIKGNLCSDISALPM